MKFTVMFKTPDALDYALIEITGKEREAAKKLAEKYIRAGEIVRLEFDVIEQTVKVVPNKEL